MTWTELITAREKRMLSQAQLASLMGLPASSICNFEVGRRKPAFNNLVKLADALDCSVDSLLGLDDRISENVRAYDALMDLDYIQATHDQDISKEVDRIRKFIKFAERLTVRPK